jgi:putative copper export protein
MDLKKIAVVVNGFMHDFTSGYWVSAMIAIYFLHDFRIEYPLLSGSINNIERFFFWNSIMAVLVILLTGAGRSFTYVDNVFGEQTEGTRRRLLIGKHVILIAIFGAGSWWAFQATFR